MPKSELYQKTCLIKFCFFTLFLCFHCHKGAKPNIINPISKKVVTEGLVGIFAVQNKDTYVLLHGFKDQHSGKSIPLLLDTGSDLTFLSDENITNGKPLLWEGNSYSFPTRSGILPNEILGVIGLDFFQQTCIWWEDDTIAVYRASSSVCLRPQAYFSTNLKLLSTTKKDSFYYVRFFKEEKKYWGLVDTGATISHLPVEFETNAASHGKKNVFLAGGKIQEANLFFNEAHLYLETKEGNSIPFKDFYFLNGISLEHLDLTREKDSETVGVIGLELLQRFPLFWDFQRNSIGLLNPPIN
ncbi:MAG: hypothetical protein SH817_06560 [Leptospira sp.]|nr:hypothetical protein [Leptospira sp.]